MPRYVLEKRIGEGGMAEVFLARNAESGLTCAVKRLLPELRRDVRLQTRFIDEARIASRLNHPGILAVLDFYEDAGVQHLVMELIDGASAEDLIGASVPGLFVPIPVVASAVLAIAQALKHAHERGVLHRDVSACNVMISKSGEVKLADFGLADAVGRMAATEPGSIAGKFEYLSPARQRGDKAAAADDAFALGVMLDRLLSAADPRDRAGSDGSRLAHLRKEFAAEHPPRWPEWIDALRQFEPASPETMGSHVREVVSRRTSRYSR